MHPRDWLQLGLFIGGLIAITPLLGSFLVRVFSGERHFLTPLLGAIERSIYRLSALDPAHEMSWREYAVALLLFNFFGGAILLALELTQAWLPLNPRHLPNVPFALAFNTAVSFTTNTNWQAYSGESTLSYFTQMAGLAVHNFVSAATGVAVAVALARGLVRRQAKSIGNFWADLTRCTLYVLLPLSVADCGRPDAAGRRAILSWVCKRLHARRRVPSDPARSGRFADRHQATRHERRRLLRPEQHASFRKPDAADQFH